MSLSFKKILLLGITTFVIFSLIIAGVNLGLKLTQTEQPKCDPLFCKEIVDEVSYCLLSTPGAESCLKVAGWFFVPSLMLSYLLLFISFGLSLLISQKFYLERWLVVLGLLALEVFIMWVMLGVASSTPFGIVL